MEQKLQQFIADYVGKTGQGNTTQNKGQCVGLVSLWQDVLQVPHEYGNAKDLLANANKTFFDVTYNDPNNYNQYPVPGDIMVWGDSWGNGFGHTGVVVTATGNSFTSFEQNDVTPQDPNGACAVLGHTNYQGVLGWLHFKGQLTATSAINTDGLNTYGLDASNIASNQVVFSTWNDVKNGLYIPIAQYKALESSNETLQGNFDTLNGKYNEDERTIINLKGQLTQNHQEDLDYSQKAYEAGQLTVTYKKYMNDIADELRLSPSTQTDAQLHEEILNEIAQLRSNQKTPEGEVAPDKTLTTWENGFKNIVDWIIQHGLNDYLKENNLQVVDLDGNPTDEGIADRVVAYLDDRFHRLDFLENAITNAKAQVEKGKNLFAQFLGLFIKSA